MAEPSDFTSYDPAGLPATPPPRDAAPGHLVGQADGVQLRTESDPVRVNELITVLSFRLRVPDRPQPVEVELRGATLSGSVHPGDWVEVPSPSAAGGLLSVATATNLTTGASVAVPDVRASRSLRVVFLVVFALIAIAILVFFGVIVFDLLDLSGGTEEFWTE